MSLFYSSGEFPSKDANDFVSKRSGVNLRSSKTMLGTLNKSIILFICTDIPRPPVQNIASLNSMTVLLIQWGKKPDKISVFDYFANKIQCTDIILKSRICFDIFLHNNV